MQPYYYLTKGAMRNFDTFATLERAREQAQALADRYYVPVVIRYVEKPSSRGWPDSVRVETVNPRSW